MGAHLDPRSLDELLSHTAWLRRLARGLARDPHELEDGLQDTWCAALAHPPQPERDPRPWLARVLRNFLVERRRGECARARRDERAARDEALPSSAEIVEDIELRALVLELLRAQREPYRRTLYLRYVEDLSAAEIARRERIPAGTVRARVKRGLDAMRGALDERLGDRRSWCALLLARFGAPHSAAAATRGLPLLGPVLAMSATAKALVGAVVLMALAFGIWQVQRVRSVEPASAVTVPSERSFSVEAERAPHAAGGSASAREPAAAPEVALRSGAPSGPAGERAFEPAAIELRFVDESGLGLPDVLLRTAGTEPPGFVPIEATSDGRGEVRAEVEMLAPSAAIVLYTTHPDRARRFLELRLEAGGSTTLGDVLLLPKATLSGVVRDEAGREIAGATIRACPPATRNDDPERARRMGPVTSSHDVFHGESDSNGRFRIEGVAIGERRVWAGAEGFYWSSTEPLRLARDEERDDVELVLKRLPAELALHGVVRAPDGEPVPYASLEARCELPDRRWRDQVAADAGGHFTVLADHARPHELRAVDSEGRWAPVFAFDAMPGGPELVLQFREPHWLTVRARGEQGEAIAAFTAAVRFPGEERPHFVEMPRPSDEGELRLLVPQRDFHLELEAAGYFSTRLGPFLAADAPSEVVATLTSAPGLRGVVTAGGEPLAGAQVELGRLDAEQALSIDGFRCRFPFEPGGFATTGTDGSFVINLTRPGRYVLVAHHVEHASAELGPLELDPSVGASDLRLELGSGGTIEGTVSLTDGSDPAGRVVAASRGDGHVRTTRVERDGSYRFEKLCPGPWQLALRGRDDQSNGGFAVGTFGPATDPEPIRWSCEVFEGGVTRHDLSDGDD